MKHSLIPWFSLLGGALGACTSLSNQPALEALQSGSSPAVNAQYVEAFIEYRGPDSRWAGPTPFVFHIEAKSDREPEISVLPENFGKPEILSKARKLASDSGAGAGATALTQATVREKLGQLAQALQTEQPSFVGCLSPIRVRLTRLDGGVLEKQGCRSDEGWPKVASSLVYRWLTLHRYGAEREPASSESGESGEE